MAIDKPQKPANLVPRSFGGEKNNFSNDLIANGYEVNVPQTYNGDNLNYQLDATGKELDYCEKVVDYLVNIPVNNIPLINSNNKLDYINKDNIFSNNYADKSFSNIDDTAKAYFDEKWTNPNNIIVFEGRDLSTSSTLVPFTLDFLPDNGEYEILFTAGVTLLYNNTYCYGSINISSDIINTPFPGVRISGSASTGHVYIKGTVILPVKNKKIYLSGDTANQYSNGDLMVVGYRKLGVGFDTTT